MFATAVVLVLAGWAFDEHGLGPPPPGAVISPSASRR